VADQKHLDDRWLFVDRFDQPRARHSLRHHSGFRSLVAFAHFAAPWRRRVGTLAAVVAETKWILPRIASFNKVMIS
jgi:hypothetical protein